MRELVWCERLNVEAKAGRPTPRCPMSTPLQVHAPSEKGYLKVHQQDTPNMYKVGESTVLIMYLPSAVIHSAISPIPQPVPGTPDSIGISVRCSPEHRSSET